jgi:hypothetical protein
LEWTAGRRDFSSGLVVSNATLGGDSAGLFTPFILDPQNSAELLVGTCRIWRGAADGTGFSLLTDNFETGGTESCTGGEVNMVRAIAAGGPTDPDGSSNVMYAGTDGLGPLAPGGPYMGGHKRQRRSSGVDGPHGRDESVRVPDLGRRH